ncbi:MAG: molybdopterin-dependent oxidoreductase, partial [Gammaproteobacteria bacterium]|nr:molybdopterin-dependent oxidoreductase [Gammaproteobacteria bacterium]
ISWDQVLTEISDKMLDVMVEHGPKTIVGGGGAGAGLALAQNAGTATIPNVNTEFGDDQEGAMQMFGNSAFGDSADNWYYSDILVVWVANPSYTQITNYHFLTEARYNGTEVWVISADFNASAIQADLWVPVTPGSDAALWMGVCQVLIEEGLHKEEFIKEQTDLPLLVRNDNGKYLRETDRVEDGRDYVFYMYDEKRGEIVEAPFKSLLLDDIDPVLEGEWEVDTLEGPVSVRPVFTNFKEMLDSEYTPEQASESCNVHPDVIRRMARKFGKAKGVCQASATYGIGKYYHGNLMQRGMYSPWVLCGHIGRKGAGVSAEGAILSLESPTGGSMSSQGERAAMPPQVDESMIAEWQERGFSEYRMKKEVFGLMEKDTLNSRALFFWEHAGILDLSKENNSWDPHLKRPVGEYWDEAFDSGTRGVWPPRGTDPKIWLSPGGDPVRRIRANQHMIKTLIPKLEMIVVTDFRWNATSRWADYVLPAAGYSERTTAQGGTVLNMPFAHVSVKSVEPLYESRSDFWIGIMLLRKIAERAKKRGISTLTDPHTGQDFQVDKLDVAATRDGKYTENDDEALARDTFNNATNIDLPDWEALKKRGWAEFTSPGSSIMGMDQGVEVTPGDPWVPLTRHTQRKEPWTTLTGRIQFYIDHDWFIELGEAFSVHKDSIKAGGDFPIQLIGGHARHSIHSTWSDNALMLQLQRGVPLMWMCCSDAVERGIEDGDTVEVTNDIGDFEIQVTTSPAVPPGLAIIYHHWTNQQHKNWKQFQRTMPTPFNPVEMAPVTYSEYPNLHRDVWAGEPGFNDRDTRVEIRKA